MRKLILFVLFLFLISFISAQEISFNYPDEVSINEEFNVQLELINFSQDIYDVKIDILSNGNRIAKILNNGEWKSTYYYIIDAIEPGNQEEFTLKIIENFEIALIIVKIRDSGGSTKTFEGYEINLKQGSEPPPQTPPNPNLSNTNFSSINGSSEDEEETIEEQMQNITTSPLKKEDKEIQTIKLNSNTSKTQDTKPLNNKNYSPYYLLIFCFLLALLYLLKEHGKKKIKKNEFR